MPLLRAMGRILIVVLAGGLLAQALIVFAPGYSSDEREMDPGLSVETRQALLKAKEQDSRLFVSYYKFLTNLLHGDLGVSQSLGRPVRELLSDRLPVTMLTIVKSVTLGWLLGFGLAVVCSIGVGSFFEKLGQSSANLLLCLPAALSALLLLIWGDAREAAVVWVVALALAPRIFRYSFNLLRQSYESPHVLLAKAKGLGPARILLRHIIPPVGGQLIALAALSISLGLSAAIPAEVVLDVPGIGQLAWQAAISRDLPLLINLTFVVALIGTTANALSDHWLAQEVPGQ